MNSDTDNVLYILRGTIPNFDINSFTCKRNIPPKAQHVLACALFNKSVQDMEVKFDITTKHKPVLECLQMLMIFF
jgi:hypothetical protein